MTAPKPIDLSTWARREHFEFYRDRVPCEYAITVELDVTALTAALKNSPARAYVSQIWAIATIVNRHDEFRLTLDADDRPAVWDHIDPSFTIFNSSTETFSNIWATYDADFAVFHDRAAGLIDTHKNSTEFFPAGASPANTIDISSLPWASFTSFALHIADNSRHLLPIFTLGRRREVDGHITMPLALQINHASADGFHAARLLNEIQGLISEPDWVL